ncbi:MAG: hypothetical protein HGA44_05550 [Cellulomonadaceae bacterium]|nr:hypothetical protein [Cellulomonadaceae bacterium]
MSTSDPFDPRRHLDEPIADAHADAAPFSAADTPGNPPGPGLEVEPETAGTPGNPRVQPDPVGAAESAGTPGNAPGPMAASATDSTDGDPAIAAGTPGNPPGPVAVSQAADAAAAPSGEHHRHRA